MTQKALFHFETDPEIYDRYALDKYKCFVKQIYYFLINNISNNPNCHYKYGNNKEDKLVLDTEDIISIEVFEQNLLDIRNSLAAGFDQTLDYEVQDKYIAPAAIDFTTFTINAVNNSLERVTNKKRANRLFKNFYNASNANGLKDFIETALFKNGINHNFVVITYHSNDQIIYTYHLADNLEMSIGVTIPDVTIKNADVKCEDYFTTMRIHCSLDVIGYKSCMCGMME